MSNITNFVFLRYFDIQTRTRKDTRVYP